MKHFYVIITSSGYSAEFLCPFQSAKVKFKQRMYGVVQKLDYATKSVECYKVVFILH